MLNLNFRATFYGNVEGNCKILLFMLLPFFFNRLYAQAPNISYQTPEVYTTYTAITQLSPKNTGGAVPQNAYGQVSTLAGNGNAGSADGQGTAAEFNAPRAIAIDKQGNLYIADRSNNKIRKITPQGFVTTFAGSGAAGAANETGANATFTNPNGVTIDASGNIYVADSGNQLIRSITPTGAVSTLAGSGSTGDRDGKQSASFDFPNDLVADNPGNLYVSNYASQEMRRIGPDGIVHTVAGNPLIGFKDGTGPTAQFYNPGGITIDASGNIIICDVGNDAIRKMTPDSVVTTIAGTGSKGYADGQGTNAAFNYPANITIDQLGNMYVSDSFNYLVRKISPSGNVGTLAGIQGSPGFTNGNRHTATFGQIFGVAADQTGDLYIADGGNSAIRKILLTGYDIDKTLPAGLVFDATTGTISGTPAAASPASNYTITAYNLYGSSSAVVNITVNLVAAQRAATPPIISYQTPQIYFVNTTIKPLAPVNTGGAVPPTNYGQVTTLATGFNLPNGLTADAQDNIYVTDDGNYLIKKITQDGTVSVFAGTGNAGFINGTGASSSFTNLSDIKIDGAGNFLIADAGNNVIRKATQAAVVTTFAGNGMAGYANGPAANATFYVPKYLAIDLSGNIYISDSENALIRKITPGGTVSTFAGIGQPGGANGTATTAEFNLPEGLAFDAAGNLFVADQGNSTIKKIDPQGNVTSFAGNSIPINTNGDGQALDAGFDQMLAVTVDPGGNVFTADESSIRKITPDGKITTVAGSLTTTGLVDGTKLNARFHNIFALGFDRDGNLYASDAANNAVRKIITTGYDIEPGLPYGLSFDSTTGIISGTPAMVSPDSVFTITAYNAAGNSNAQVHIRIISPISLAAMPDKSACDTDFTPVVTGGTGTYSYTSSNAAVATIVAGKVHITGGGTTTITATDGYTSQSQLLTVTAVPPVTVNVTASANNIYFNTPVKFTATVTGSTALLYQWMVNNSAAGANSPTFTSSTLANGDDVVYCVVNPDNGCIVADTSNKITIQVIALAGLVIPTAFTPNNDGINDQWNIYNITDYPDCIVDVFNRYGELMYHSKGYAKPWDGTFKGGKLSTGTYYYVIDLGNNTPKLSGYVALIR
jgi:gliding motility-associated-like protein